MRIESASWAAGLQLDAVGLERRLLRSAGGRHVVVEADGDVVAVIYSHRISGVDALRGRRFDTVHEAGDPRGGTVHVLSLNVLPTARGAGASDVLLEHLLNAAAADPSVSTVVGVSRCSHRDSSLTSSLEEYATSRDERGEYVDPVLRMHQAHGAEVVGVVPGYRPADQKNDGDGVLVEYDLESRRRGDAASHGRESGRPPVPEDADDLAQDIRSMLLAAGARDAPDLLSRPFFEVGVTSAGLLEIRAMVRDRYGVSLSAVFFFENATGEALIRRLRSGSRPSGRHDPAPMDPGDDSAVAVIGMSYRLPGGIHDPESLWALLESGRLAVTPPPTDRGDRASAGSGSPDGRGGFVMDGARFEEALFRVAPREAERMDPQQRWALELAWACAEDAGIRPSDLAGSDTGVFVGASGSEYQRAMDAAGVPVMTHSGLGTATSLIANRISWVFDLRGPSMQIDTACSSSLVALHAALQALRSGDCTTAVVIGVNTLAHAPATRAYDEAGMLSHDAVCRTFDARADGYVRAEGGVALLLRRRSEATLRGDLVHGVVRGSAVSHGGRSAGLTVPSARAQSALIRRSWQDAGVTAADVGYIQAHGTGTALGDPLEVAGLVDAFDGAPGRCGLGSVKTSIGHLEAAAGLAGFVTAIEALRRGLRPGSAHLDEVNPEIDLGASGLYPVRGIEAWAPDAGRARIAGVSSFGSGGANAHVVLEEAPLVAAAPGGAVDGVVPVVLSAMTEELLVAQAGRLLGHLRRDGSDGVHLADIAHTMRHGRDALPERLTVQAVSVADLVDALHHFVESRRARPQDVRQRRDRDVDDVPAQPAGTRIRLPTHVFGGPRRWFSAPEGAAPEMLPRTLTGAESFLRDHVVNGRPVLPAAATVAMVGSAVAARTGCSASDGVALRDVVWVRPASADRGLLTVDVVFDPGEDVPVTGSGDAAPEQWTLRSDRDGVIASGATEASGQPPGRIDIRGVRARTTPSALDVDERYRRFADAGLTYGVSHRTVHSVSLGHGEWLAELVSPADAPADPCGSVDPGVVDGALQSIYEGFLERSTDAAAARPAPLPFSAASVEVFAPTPQHAFAWGRTTPGVGDASTTYDLDVADRDGRVCVRLTGVVLRTPPERSVEVPLLLEPVWSDASVGVSDPADETRVLLVFDRDRAVFLEQRLPGTRIVFVDAGEGIAAQTAGLGRAVTALAAGTGTDRVFVQVVVDEGSGSSRALVGLLRCYRLEEPRFDGQLVVVAPDTPDDAVLANLDWRESDIVSVMRTGAVTPGWQPVAAADAAHPGPWRPGGVYLLVGGAGGLGRHLMTELAGRAPGCVIVVAGRSPASLEWAERERELGHSGARLEHHQVDCADPLATRRLVNDVAARHGALHGVFHLAATLEDALVAKSTDGQIARVLRSKAESCRVLDTATADLELDLFVVFSSIIGHVGNSGQSSYAVANLLVDQLALDRTAGRACGDRHGRTLVVDWPLWRSGGMVMPAGTQDELRSRTGLTPISTAAGMAALAGALSSNASHVVVASAGADQIGRHLDRVRSPEPDRPAVASPSAPHVDVAAVVVAALSAVTGIPEDDLDPATRFGDVGLDSILATDMTVRLERQLGPLPKTILFEHQDVASLVGRLTARLGAPAGGGLTPIDPPPNVGSSAREPEAHLPGDDVVQLGQRPVGRGGGRPLDIAVIGLAGRYPGSRDMDGFWKTLRDGIDRVETVPTDRWDWRAHYSADRHEPGGHHSRWGGFIDGVDRFDPMFFEIAPVEADHMDPQERLFLEESWAALEDAGYRREDLARGGPVDGRVGVYAGAMWSQYQLLFESADGTRGNPSALGSSFASIANRVSFVLDVHGPSLTLDTMCSSSLTAIDLASRDLAHGVTNLALAGGVNLTVHPNKYLGLSTGQFISSAGHCESFGSGGDGYVPSEGVGVVVLKRLEDALRDGDHVYGVIAGSAIAHGGRTSGFTVPNPDAQEQVIREALTEARVDPSTLQVVEAHGTGTALGDPIEIAALSRVLGLREDGPPVLLGSVKSNIGHGESAAGVAGLTKVLLQLEHDRVAPSLHSTTLNPRIDFEQSRFVVAQELTPWERPVVDGAVVARSAGVSSFGAGGSNAHLVVREHVEPRRTRAGARPRVALVLSAKTPDRLAVRAADLARFLHAHPDVDLRDVGFTLHTGREVFAERVAVVGDDTADLAARLLAFASGDVDDRVVSARAQRRTPGADVALEPTADMTQRAHAWAQGATVLWEDLTSESGGRRISLPTYPFARERHWVPEHERARTSADGPARAGVPETSTPTGRQTAEPERVATQVRLGWRAAPVDPEPVEGTVVVLHDEETERLAHEVQRLATGRTVLRSGSAEAGDLPEGCAVLVDLTTMSHSHAFERSDGWFRALLRFRRGAPVRLLVVTRGLQSFENDRVELVGSVGAGVVRALAAEYRLLTARHVDLDPADRSLSASAARVLDETVARGQDVDVCHRRGHRFVSTFESDRSEQDPGDRRVQLGEDDVVVVSGGTRGLGSLTARHLARHHGVRRFLLLGREGLPPRSEWAERTTSGGAEAARIATVLELERSGAVVVTAAVRLDDVDDVRRAVSALPDSWGRVTGVVHAAGIVDSDIPAYVEKTEESVATVLSPKVSGTEALLTALDVATLRFALLFSSVAGAVPRLGAGLSDYAGANAHLDHVAEAHAVSPAIVTSVRWPSWRDSGFGAVGSVAYADLGLLTITDEEGLRVVDQVLDGRHGAVVTPLIVDPDRFALEALSSSDPRDLAELPAPRDPGPARVGDVELTSHVARLVAGPLGLDPALMDADGPFASYGADSVLLAQAGRSISAWLGVDVPPSLLLEHDSVGAVAAWVAAEHPERVADAVTRATPDEPDGPDEPDIPRSAASHPRSAASIESSHGGDPRVAIVGMACRFAGASDVEAYWSLLHDGRPAFSDVPVGRWPGEESWRAGLLAGPRPDGARFGIDLGDARAMDPQALLLLEQVAEALVDAGHHGDWAGSRTGVFVGARGRHPEQDADVRRHAPNAFMADGQNFLAANIARTFDWHGPALVVDTACSSSLVALQLAVEALARGRVDVAVVAGVHLFSDASEHRAFAARGLLTEDDPTVFDGGSSGVLLGEGAGVVVLRREDDARRDCDGVYALVAGVAVNNDGRTAGPAAPNLRAQRAVMTEALQAAACTPDQVRYLTANASGGATTDLLELSAIRAAYRDADDTPLYLGSMKPVIGHPLCAEGMAALIQTVLVLQHQRVLPLAPTAGRVPLAHARLQGSGLVLPDVATDVDAPFASVSSFADGGTNAHVVLARAVRGRPPLPPRRERSALPVDPRRAGGHAVGGRDIVPGLVTIEALVRVFIDRGHSADAVDLTDVTLHRPIELGAVAGSTVDLVRAPTGAWDVTVMAEARVALTGRVTISDGAATRGGAQDRSVVGAADRLEDLDTVYAQWRAVGVVHTGVAKVSGSVGVDARGLCISLHEIDGGSGPGTLSGSRSGNTVPSGIVLDAGAVAAVAETVPDLLAEGALLPLHVRRLRCWGPLGQEVTVRVRDGETSAADGVVTLSLDYFDAAGRLAASLTGLTCAVSRSAQATPPGGSRVRRGNDAPASPTRSFVEMVSDLIAAEVGVGPEHVDPRVTHFDNGLSSAGMVHLASRLEEASGLVLSPTLLFEHLTVDELVAHLVESTARAPGLQEPMSLQGIVGSLADGRLDVDDAIALLESDPPESDRHGTDSNA
ncbi:SDR family NAD(P)-dependent oxidoreductase [Rathayibacter tritici]|nr:SDR family NAD(P)-dependent oxidoreductase [Rathayibacter tritici]